MNQRARSLYFLHGLGWQEEDGKTVARYVVHFVDGKSNTIEVVYGRDIRNWQFWPERVAQEDGGAVPAWKGRQERWKTAWPNCGVRLYKLNWTNPRPDVEIKSVDLVSTMTESSPFVIAITAEP